MSDHVFWVYWTAVVVGFLLVFLPVEIYGAIKDSDVDTLSAWVWRLLGTKQPLTWWTGAKRLVAFLLFLWLAEHFAFGWV